DDDSSDACGDVRFEGPSFTLTVTATDNCDNEGTTLFVFPSRHHGHKNNGIHRGNDKGDNHHGKGKHKSEGKKKIKHNKK
ncbi:MAG: hypothetical protein V3U21_02345, partial [Thermodesulfobacteriota bacterium]